MKILFIGKDSANMFDETNRCYNLSLVPIRDEDNSFLFRLYCSTREEEMRLTDWPENEKLEFLKMQYALQHHHYTTYYPDASFQKILVDGQDAGGLYVERWEREIRIMDIALLPEYRGKGIGYHFMRQIMDEAQARQSAVSLHVEHFNPALQFYERLGFLKIESTGVYHLMKWTPPADARPGKSRISPNP
jgi:ribosomal protein S18 acetylase RimI-like enzyme